uniref:BTB/POZ domain-containing protein 17 n=1 Tax=Myxine glutinosa TaxID=7769 RepID=UPI00358F1199
MIVPAVSSCSYLLCHHARTCHIIMLVPAVSSCSYPLCHHARTCRVIILIPVVSSFSYLSSTRETIGPIPKTKQRTPRVAMLSVHQGRSIGGLIMIACCFLCMQASPTGNTSVSDTVQHSARLLAHLAKLLNNPGTSDIMLIVRPRNSVSSSSSIGYLYTGHVDVRLDHCTALHALATELGVPALCVGLSTLMAENLPYGPVVSWYTYAIHAKDQILASQCNRFMAWNFSAIAASSEWPQLSVTHILQLLQRSDLVIESEMALFSAIELWIKRNQPNSSVVEAMLGSIRYPMMSSLELLELLKVSTTLKRHLHTIEHAINTAFRFHSVSPHEFGRFVDLTQPSFIPRNYLGLGWGRAWAIQNPARDDRSMTFKTWLSPSSRDRSRSVSWNAIFSPRQKVLGSGRTSEASYGHGGSSVSPARLSPHLVVISSSRKADIPGLHYQKTVLVGVRKKGTMVVQGAYSFHHSSEEARGFLKSADLISRFSDYLVDSALHLHIIVKPVYQPLLGDENDEHNNIKNDKFPKDVYRKDKTQS